MSLNLKTAVFILILVGITAYSRAQIIDIDYTKGVKGLTDTKKPEFLQNGFLDFLSDGNVQASARLLKLNIGEENVFYLPFYVYTGTSGKAFGDSKSNQTTVSNLLNPIGGLVNVSFNGLQNIPVFKDDGKTKLRFAYQFGARVLNGSDSVTTRNMNFFNGLANIGLFFQTGAWEGDNADNMGMFYIQVKASGSFSSKSDLQKLFGDNVVGDNYFYGYSFDAGIEINQVINTKLSVYQYLNNTNISLLKEPLVKFSLDYSFK